MANKDYFIYKKLKLEYINRVEFITLSVERCYDIDIDSDEENYHAKMYNKYLSPIMEPILIYHNKWIKDIFYYKYDKLIEDKKGLKKIIKIEERKINNQ
jgi:hypothetical protein